MADSKFSTAQSHKANLRRLRKQTVHRYWDYIDDFEDWRCLDRRCKVTNGIVSIQSWPRATADTKLRLYNMATFVGEIHEQVPLVHRVFDIVEDKGAVLVISELPSHGNLWDALKATGKIEHIPWLVCEVLVPLMVVLHHMHESGIMHRNVNPSAVLFHGSGSACIGAFKLAARQSDVDISENETPIEFTAPEVLLCCAYAAAEQESGGRQGERRGSQRPANLSYSYPVDVWGLGITLYLCLTGRMPFMATDDNLDGIHDNILFAEPPLPREVEPFAADFIQQCLQKQPSDRPDIKQLLAHDFVTDHIKWSADPHERLPDEYYQLPRAPTTPLQKSVWQRMRGKVAGTKSSFPMAIVNHTSIHCPEPQNVLAEKVDLQTMVCAPGRSYQKEGGISEHEGNAKQDGDGFRKWNPQATFSRMTAELAPAASGAESQGSSLPQNQADSFPTQCGEEQQAVHPSDPTEQNIAPHYDLSTLRTLDENIVSQLDLSDDATAVAMKRLSMWQEQADAAVANTAPRASGLLLIPAIDSATNPWTDGPGTPGSSGDVKRLMTWSRQAPEQPRSAAQPSGPSDSHHSRIKFHDSARAAFDKEDSLEGLMEGVDVVEEEVAMMDANSSAAPRP